jgi:hypothetical protein
VLTFKCLNHTIFSNVHTFVFNYSEYEVCLPEYFTKELGVCKQYPSFQPCGCPLKAGEVHLKDIEYPLPDLGDWASVIAVSLTGF